jgi:hypothetical protein
MEPRGQCTGNRPQRHDLNLIATALFAFVPFALFCGDCFGREFLVAREDFGVAKFISTFGTGGKPSSSRGSGPESERRFLRIRPFCKQIQTNR